MLGLFAFCVTTAMHLYVHPIGRLSFHPKTLARVICISELAVTFTQRVAINAPVAEFL
jgi:hypothetical protein